LLSTYATAIISAIGAISSTRSGMIRLVRATKTRMVWPWFVIRSILRNACVIHMSMVTQTSTTANAPRVVRKMYRPIDPIGGAVPDYGCGFLVAPGSPCPSGATASPPPTLSAKLIVQQNGLAKANPLTVHNKTG
jgi:hypothetical protein